MDPSSAERQAAEQYVITAKNLLLAGNTERCWQLLIKALCADPGAPGANAFMAAATALRAGQIRPRLPSGAPDPYAVFGLDPAVPTSRDPAVIQSHYHRASHLLNRHHRDPCWPVFAKASRLVADAWAFLSDPDCKASLDSRFEGVGMLPPPQSDPAPPQPQPPAQTVTAQAAPPQPLAQTATAQAASKLKKRKRIPVPTASNPEMLPQPQPAPPPPQPPAQAVTAQAGPDDMGRGKRLKKHRIMMNL